MTWKTTRSMIETMEGRINKKLHDYGLSVQAERNAGGYEIVILDENGQGPRSVRGYMGAYDCWQTLRVMNETLELVMEQ